MKFQVCQGPPESFKCFQGCLMRFQGHSSEFQGRSKGFQEISGLLQGFQNVPWGIPGVSGHSKVFQGVSGSC